MTTAVGAISVCVDTVVLIYSRAIVVEVTACTIRLIRRRRPLHDFRVRHVALGTGQVAGVIQRLVDQACVHRVVRNPGVRVVTYIAFLSRDEVAGVFSGSGVSVVTG